MLNRILLGLSIAGSASLYAGCITEGKDGFTIPGKDSQVQTYSCESRFFPYFSQVNYVIDSGISCFNRAYSESVRMDCENNSRQERDVSRVVLQCCDQQVHPNF